MPQANWFERHPRLTISVTLAAIVLFAELFLQGWFYCRHGYFVFNDPFQISFIEPVAGEREYRLKSNYRSPSYRINEFGYRGRAVHGDPDILVLGDSVHFGSGAPEDKTYSYFLNDRYGIKVMNGGVPSYTLWQAVERWKEDFSDVRPTIVVLGASNDVSLLTRYQYEWQPRTTWFEERWSGGLAFEESIAKNFAFHHYWSDLITKWNWQREALHDESKEGEVPEEFQEPFMNHISRSIDEAIQHSIETKAILILVPINPFYYMKPGDEWKNKSLKRWKRSYFHHYETSNKLYRMVNQLMAWKADQYPHVHFFDVVSAMDEMDRNKLYRDFIHLSPYGHATYAKLLLDFLYDRGLLAVGSLVEGAASH